MQHDTKHHQTTSKLWFITHLLYVTPGFANLSYATFHNSVMVHIIDAQCLHIYGIFTQWCCGLHDGQLLASWLKNKKLNISRTCSRIWPHGLTWCLSAEQNNYVERPTSGVLVLSAIISRTSSRVRLCKDACMLRGLKISDKFLSLTAWCGLMPCIVQKRLGRKWTISNQ